MQLRQARSDSSRCIARPNSSSASIFDSFFTCIFLYSFRHHFKTTGGTEMANVEQTQKMIPFITCEIFLLSVCLRVVFSCQCIWFGFLVSKLILSNNQSRATLWVLKTCLIVGLLPFMIILITASLYSNTYNKAFWREELTFEEIKSTLSRSSIIPWDCFRFWSVWGATRTSRRFVHGSPHSWLFWCVFPWSTATIRSHNSRAGKPSNLSPVSREMISDSVGAVRNWRLFLTHPTYWNKRMASENAQCSTWSGFRIFKISRKVRILKQSQSALFCSVSHIRTLFGPFCDRSCKCVHWP